MSESNQVKKLTIQDHARRYRERKKALKEKRMANLRNNTVTRKSKRRRKVSNEVNPSKTKQSISNESTNNNTLEMKKKLTNVDCLQMAREQKKLKKERNREKGKRLQQAKLAKKLKRERKSNQDAQKTKP